MCVCVNNLIAAAVFTGFYLLIEFSSTSFTITFVSEAPPDSAPVL